MTITAEHKWHRIGAYLGLAALFLQVSFSFVHSSAFASKLVGKDFGQGLFDVLVICTPAGLKTVRLYGDDDGTDHPTPHSPEDTCPTCSHLAAKSFLMPGRAAIGLSLGEHRVFSELRDDQIVGVEGPVFSLVRAPPLS